MSQQQTGIISLELALLGIVVAGAAVWQLRVLNRHLAEVKEPLKDLLRHWADHLQFQDQLFEARRRDTELVAKTVVVARTEVFPANAEPGARGAAVFGVRNVGNEAVFVLGVTRDQAEGAPPGPVTQVLGVGDVQECYLTLEPELPPLDVADVALWYRDLSGRLWVRRTTDEHASLMERPPAPVPEPVPVPEPELEAVPTEAEPGGRR
jgi:hypothetical protein